MRLSKVCDLFPLDQIWPSLPPLCVPRASAGYWPARLDASLSFTFPFCSRTMHLLSDNLGGCLYLREEPWSAYVYHRVTCVTLAIKRRAVLQNVHRESVQWPDFYSSTHVAFSLILHSQRHVFISMTRGESSQRRQYHDYSLISQF